VKELDTASRIDIVRDVYISDRFKNATRRGVRLYTPQEFQATGQAFFETTETNRSCFGFLRRSKDTWKRPIRVGYRRLPRTSRPPGVLNTVVKTLERFVVLMNFNAARRYFFSKKSREIENIPVIATALFEDTKRAAFQAGHICGQCIVTKPFVPSPGDWDWEKCDGEFYGPWFPRPPVTQLLELLSCLQVQEYCRENCKCHRANIQCTSLCACVEQCNGKWVNCVYRWRLSWIQILQPLLF